MRDSGVGLIGHPNSGGACLANVRARLATLFGEAALAVVVPHEQGRLPQALKAGLANLDEHAVASMGFARLLLVRPAATPQAPPHANVLEWLAHRMLSIFAYMVPSNEMPPRAADLAALVDEALRAMPPGVHIAPPELARRTTRGHGARDRARLAGPLSWERIAPCPDTKPHCMPPWAAPPTKSKPRFTKRCRPATSKSSWPAGPTRTRSSASTPAARVWWAWAPSAPRLTRMFAHGGSVHVQAEQIRRVDSLASAVHHVLERVEVMTPEGPAKAYVLATNVYHKTPQGWRLVVHHASPGTAEDAAHTQQTPQVLH